MVNVCIFGASGVLGHEVSRAFMANGASVTQISHKESVQESFFASEDYNIVVFCNGHFEPLPASEITHESMMRTFSANILFPMQMTYKFLSYLKDTNHRKDFVYIGSTSSYTGFANSSDYCASKFALRGLVESLNAEYSLTNTRFWLVSTGTFTSRMSDRVHDQDPTTFLDPMQIATRIVGVLDANSSAFEPEILIRRRFLR